MKGLGSHDTRHSANCISMSYNWIVRRSFVVVANIPLVYSV